MINKDNKKIINDEELEEVSGGWTSLLADDGDVQKAWKGKQSNQQLGDNANELVFGKGLDPFSPARNLFQRKAALNNPIGKEKD